MSKLFGNIRHLAALSLFAFFLTTAAIIWQTTSFAQKFDPAFDEIFNAKSDDMAPQAGTISGRVFQDFSGNGRYDTGGGTSAAPLAVDTGVANVTVSAFDSTGAARGTTLTAVNGTFSLAATGTGPYRIEFTTIPSGFLPSARSTDSVLGGTTTNAGSTTQFVNDLNTSNVNLALNRAQDYCEDNPLICSQMYAAGDVNLVNSVFTIPYQAGSTRTTGGNPVTDFESPGNTSLATANQVGTTFGIAYQRTTRQIFVASFMKKHAKFGPGGTGAIYQVNRGTGAVSTYVNVNTVFGANTAGANPHNVLDYDIDNGQATWDAVGKVAFGGMAISDDGANLYTMNLNDRRLYRIPTTGTLNTTTISRQAFPATMPNCTNASDVRPFAVSFYEGLIYVGAICSADVSDATTDLWAYVYTVNPTTLAFNTTPVLQFRLNYARQETDPGYSANWLAWRTNYSTISPSHFIYPQPLFTDIEFDRGNMVLGIRDRNGDQSGYNSPSNPNDPTQLFKGITAGDMLRACGNPGSGWTLESNGRCAGIGNAPQGSNEGPGGGEFYYQENYHPNGTPHDEVALGGSMQIPGHPVLVATIFDPTYIPDDNIYDAGGFRWFNNGTGGQNRGYLAYESETFGKANGIGNVASLCEAAPIEIGNRVWRDTNGNGVQDPGENGIAGVTVRLYQGSTRVGTAVTDANGEYYFVTSAVADGDLTNNIGLVSLNGGILFNTAYQVRFDLPANYTSGNPLSSLSVTLQNQTSQLGDDDSSDSDASMVANPVGSPAGVFPVISVTTGSSGSNNHTFDVGFSLLGPSAANVSVSGRIATANGNGIRNVRVFLTEEDGTVHNALTGSFGYYIFEEIAGGQNVVVSVAAKRYTFPQTARLVTLNESAAEIDWISNE